MTGWLLRTPFLTAALLTVSLPALACPSGPRPSGEDAVYIAVCADGDVADDKFVLTLPLSGDDAPGYVLNARNSGVPSNGMGLVTSTARASTTNKRFINPDLHAAVIGTVGSTLRLDGNGGGAAAAEFRDILTVTSDDPRYDGRTFKFKIDFDLDGLLITPHTPFDNAFGQSAAVFNLGLRDYGAEVGGEGAGITLDTELGLEGQISTTVTLEARVRVGQRYIFTGYLDVLAFAHADSGHTADFAADFGDTADFAGYKFFADDGTDLEIPGLSITSALGFDYVVNTDATTETPEPASLALFATALAGLAARRRLSRAGG